MWSNAPQPPGALQPYADPGTVLHHTEDIARDKIGAELECARLQARNITAD
jgi:hypothetical protein